MNIAVLFESFCQCVAEEAKIHWVNISTPCTKSLTGTRIKLTAWDGHCATDPHFDINFSDIVLSGSEM